MIRELQRIRPWNCKHFPELHDQPRLQVAFVWTWWRLWSSSAPREESGYRRWSVERKHGELFNEIVGRGQDVVAEWLRMLVESFMNVPTAVHHVVNKLTYAVAYYRSVSSLNDIITPRVACLSMIILNTCCSGIDTFHWTERRRLDSCMYWLNRK